MSNASTRNDAAPMHHGRAPTVGVLWVAGGLGIIAALAVAVLPALVGVWRDSFALRIEQSGYLAAAEIYAQVAGTAVFIALRRHVTWRALAMLSLFVLACANAASAVSSSFAALFATRCAAGVAAGLLRAQCMTAFAGAASPGLVFALYASAQVISAALVTIELPTLIAVGGPRLPFLLLAGLAFGGLYACRWLPLSAAEAHVGSAASRSIPVAALVSLAALFAYFLGQGGLWTYLNPIGKSQLISDDGIARALSVLNFAGLAGTLGIGALAHRVSPRRALLLLASITLASVFVLYRTHSATLFMLAACGFYFSWCASFPFQFSLIAAADRARTASALLPAVDALGLATGGALAGVLLPYAGLDAAAWVCAGGTLLGLSAYLFASRATTP